MVDFFGIKTLEFFYPSGPQKEEEQGEGEQDQAQPETTGIFFSLGHFSHLKMSFFRRSAQDPSQARDSALDGVDKANASASAGAIASYTTGGWGGEPTLTSPLQQYPTR